MLRFQRMFLGLGLLWGGLIALGLGVESGTVWFCCGLGAVVILTEFFWRPSDAR